jgi:exonuclease VII small subunit
MNDEVIKKFTNNLVKIVDKLEQRIAKLEKVLESHAKCIGQLRGNK